MKEKGVEEKKGRGGRLGVRKSLRREGRRGSGRFGEGSVGAGEVVVEEDYDNDDIKTNEYGQKK